MSGRIALLIVDVQNALLNDRPYREAAFLSGLQLLLCTARESGAPVLFVQHDGGEGDELEAGTDGFAVVSAVAPQEAERVFVKNRNSAFLGTELGDYLAEQGIHTLVLCGMQTEYCIDATCKSAMEQGYQVIIPKGCTTTFDNDFLSAEILCRYFEEKIWDGRFASVLPAEQVCEMLAAAKTISP